MKYSYFSKKRDIIPYLSFFIFSLIIYHTNAAECPRDRPILNSRTGNCEIKYCTMEEFSSEVCIISNSIAKKQWINDFLYETEKESPIYSSIGTNNEGDVFFESSLGTPYSTKKLFTLKVDGREYIDGIKRNIINLGNDMYSKSGIGAVVTINNHKCYLKLSFNESIEMYDFDDKKYTFAKIKEIFGYEIMSEKNSLLRTNIHNTFIFAYISKENYLMLQKFKVISNDSNNCIQLLKTLKEDLNYFPTNTRSCMITTKQYIECIDVDSYQNYVIRIYDSNLNFMKKYQLEKNNSPLNRAYFTYHETVWLKDEISIFIYYTNIGENNTKPILILKTLSVKSGVATLSNLNSYLTRDTIFQDMEYKFSDIDNSLTILNSYYFALSSITQGPNKHLIIALANIFNDDLTIDTHYFDVPLENLYDINYQSSLKSFGFKNAFGVQMNYIHNNTPSSGFIVFGYANTTDPEPINRLFDKYSSYTIKVKDFYKGIENNLFCYEFVHIEVTEIPDSLYFTVKNASKTIRKGSIITLNDELTITKVSVRNPPPGRYVLGLTPYLNEADYQGFKSCAVGSNMFGKTVPTDWYPDEFYGRTIEFKFTVDVDCFDNCQTCNERGLTLDDQKCTECKNGYYFIQNTSNCFGEIPEGYYFNETKKVYIECYESCKTCTKQKEGNEHHCKICKDNYLLYHTNCLNCKYLNKYVNYFQTECIDIIPEGYYMNNTEFNTIDKCYEKCLACSESSTNENDMKCLSCDNTKGLYLLEGTNNCIKEIKEGEYLDRDDNIIKKCNKACKTCSNKEILNTNGDVINCDSCNIDEGYHLVEGTTICTNKKYDNEYFDDECKCYKKCYKDCLTCSEKEIDKYHMNCLTCDTSKGYIYFQKTKNCLNCKSINKYVNLAQTECIDKIPDGYYVNNTELNSLNKCHPNCLACIEASSSEEDMKCLSCIYEKGLYLLEGTNNCVKPPYKGYYLDEENRKLKKCYEDCLTCLAGPIIDKNGVITNMNCGSCNELKGLYLMNDTKNCMVYEDICPKEKPILKGGICVLKYCTKEEYENKTCILSNPVVKTQWMGDFPYVNSLDKPLYSTFGQMSNDDILLETNIGNPFSERKIYTLNKNGRSFSGELSYETIKLNSDFFSTNGIGTLFKIKGQINFMRLSSYETLELYDLNEEKYTYTKLEEMFDYKVESSKNSLLKTKEENTFIYAYITIGNHLIMTKFKIITNNANNCFHIIKTSLEDFTTISKNLRRCIITKNQYIECIDLNEDQIYVIRLYDIDLNFLEEYELDINKAPKERAYYIYHEALSLKEDVSIFVYYNDISYNNAKPIVLIKKINVSNGKIELINAFNYLDKIILFSTLPYIVSDIENSISKINENKFALATVTSYQNSNLIITILRLYNNDNSLQIDYFLIPWKDLYDINYYTNLQLFGYKNTLGFQFETKKGNEYSSGFLIFGFGNSTDTEIIDNIFSERDTYLLNPSKYIKVENNIFCYRLLNIILSNIPDSSSGIIIQRNNVKKNILKKGDILSINEEIIITYTGNKEDIPKGNYIVSFIPYLREADNDDLYKCVTKREHFGEDIQATWIMDEYYGKEFNFEFSTGKCFENCMTCKILGKGIEEQGCETCKNHYFFLDGTNNCLNKPPEGYYLDGDEQKYKKCYDSCKTCINKKERNNHNCIICKENYSLFKNKNCLNCKNINKYVNYEQNDCIDNIPDGFFINDTELNTLDKCHPNCLTCKEKGIADDDMKCTSCDKDNSYFFVFGTNNCKKISIPGYYLDEEDQKIKKCDISCATCSGKAITNEKNEVKNCDTCNKELGFYNENQNSKICINKTKVKEYYDENCNCYKKCHDNCLTCSNSAIDQSHMNCFTCDLSKGYQYFSKTKNCLNCKSINKMVNYYQTECINVLPNGFYINDTDLNTIDFCHENCLTCSKAATNDSQNCLTCKPGLLLENGNCLKTIVCPNKFYYKSKIYKIANPNEKMCLKKDEICPGYLPFYYTSTNECVKSCPLELLFYQGCKISDFNYGINFFILTIRINFMQGLINSLNKIFSLDTSNNIFIKISIFDIHANNDITDFGNLRNLQLNEDSIPLYQSLSNDDLTEINIENNFEEANIYLDDCEKKLREYYNISDDVELTVIKLDCKTNDSKINQVQYEIFNSQNRSEKLDLSICQKEKIKIINTIDINSFKLGNIIEKYENNLHFPDISDTIYKNLCYKFLSENNAYVLIQDRILDYNYQEQFCQKGCTIQDININNGNIVCLCSPNNGFGNISLENFDNNNYTNELLNINNNKKNTQKYSYSNVKALKCIKGMFDSDLKKNYIFIILTILLISFLVLNIKLIVSYKKIKEEFWNNKLKPHSQKINLDNNKNLRGEIKEKTNNKIKQRIIIGAESTEPLENQIPKINKEKLNANIHDSRGRIYLEEFIKDYDKNKTSFLYMFIYSLKERDIIVCFFIKKDDPLILKLILLILSIINYIAVNTFFFSEKNIHQIYLDKNKYNLSYQIEYIISSFFISYFFLTIAKFSYTLKKNFCSISNKLQLIISFIISSIIFIFYWLYIGAVTSLFINIKKHLIINIVFCYIISFVFKVCLSIIYAICNKISI